MASNAAKRLLYSSAEFHGSVIALILRVVPRLRIIELVCVAAGFILAVTEGRGREIGRGYLQF